MRIPCILPQLSLCSSNQSEDSPHKRVPLGTAESTGHRQSSSRGRAPHCCSQSSLQDRTVSGSAHTPHLPEHQTYYWNKDRSKNVYKHNIPAAVNPRLHERKKRSMSQWHQLKIRFWQLMCGRWSHIADVHTFGYFTNTEHHYIILLMAHRKYPHFFTNQQFGEQQILWSWLLEPSGLRIRIFWCVIGTDIPLHSSLHCQWSSTGPCPPDKWVQTLKVLQSYGQGVLLAGLANVSASFPQKVTLKSPQTTQII